MLNSNVLSKLMYKCIKKVPVTVVKTEFLKHFSKQMSVYFLFLYISVRMSLFQRHSKILSSGGGGLGWGKIISLRRLAVSQFFILIESFRNSTIFSISIVPYIVLKHCNLPDNLNFKGKIFAKFLIRSHFLEIYCNITTS